MSRCVAQAGSKASTTRRLRRVSRVGRERGSVRDRTRPSASRLGPFPGRSEYLKKCCEEPRTALYIVQRDPSFLCASPTLKNQRNNIQRSPGLGERHDLDRGDWPIQGQSLVRLHRGLLRPAHRRRRRRASRVAQEQRELLCVLHFHDGPHLSTAGKNYRLLVEALDKDIDVDASL